MTYVAACGVLVTVVAFFIGMRNDISSLQDDLKDQNGLITNMEQNLDGVNEYLYQDGGVRDQLGNINEALNIKVINVTDEDTISLIDDINVKTGVVSYTMPILLSDMPVGTDSEGSSYVVKDLINQTVVLTYEEDGKEVYFLGQFNDDCNWNGYCVTNSYNQDGTLFSICESNFDNGKRIDYKSLYREGENEWILSNRLCDNDTNFGTSMEYYYDYDVVKNFTNTNVRRTDILYVDKFFESEDAVITKFYAGKTQKQRYNDDSGDAYLVKYNMDGTVNNLYVGNFVDGYCEDVTGDAWSIVYSEELGDYYYNTGVFKKNKAVKKSTEPIAREEIEQIIAKYNFQCELKWK